MVILALQKKGAMEKKINKTKQDMRVETTLLCNTEFRHNTKYGINYRGKKRNNTVAESFP